MHCSFCGLCRNITEGVHSGSWCAIVPQLMASLPIFGVVDARLPGIK